MDLFKQNGVPYVEINVSDDAGKCGTCQKRMALNDARFVSTCLLSLSMPQKVYPEVEDLSPRQLYHLSQCTPFHTQTADLI